MEGRRWILAAAALTLAAPVAAGAQQGRGGMTAERRAEMMARQAEALLADMRMERPIEALNSVWIEELTWMEVRDALRDVANPPGEVVGPGLEGISRALTLLAEGQDVNYEGAAGPVDFDEHGDVVGPIEIWKIEGGEITSTGRFELP